MEEATHLIEEELPPTPSPEIIIEIIKRLNYLEDRVEFIYGALEQIADNGERTAKILVKITERLGENGAAGNPE